MSQQGEALSVADRSFLLALRAWDTPDDALWERLDNRWRAALQGAWLRHSAQVPDAALEQLRREHAAQVRVDLTRVHPSWLLRGLREESRAVRRAAVLGAPGSRRDTLREGLGLRERGLTAPPLPSLEMLRWVAALWPERLVGDIAERADDPPAIRVLAALPPRAGVRVARTAGLAKLAGSRAAMPALSDRTRARFEWLRQALAPLGERFRDFADRDAARLGDPRARHALTRLGALTIARLLVLADPYRQRWALQQIPYGAAKFVRSLMPAKPTTPQPWIAWETEVLRVAWERLQAEGRWPRPSEISA